MNADFSIDEHSGDVNHALASLSLAAGDSAGPAPRPDKTDKQQPAAKEVWLYTLIHSFRIDHK